MARRKYILKRPNDLGREEKELKETIARMKNKNLELANSEEVKRYGKHYVQMIFQTPKDDD